jgi:hypothetical protein
VLNQSTALTYEVKNMITENLHNMDITSANSTAFMIVNKLFPAGFPVEGFGTDQAVSGDNMQIAETPYRC